jgi:hypothetical protein
LVIAIPLSEISNTTAEAIRPWAASFFRVRREGFPSMRLPSHTHGALTFNQLAEYVIWALLQPPAVDVDTIIVRCFGAMI